MNEALLRSLTTSVLGILVRRGADFAAAEDAVQDALVEAVRVWPADPPQDPKGWLITMAWRPVPDPAPAGAPPAAPGGGGEDPRAREAGPRARAHRGRHAPALLSLCAPVADAGVRGRA